MKQRSTRFLRLFTVNSDFSRTVVPTPLALQIGQEGEALKKCYPITNTVSNPLISFTVNREYVHAFVALLAINILQKDKIMQDTTVT